MYNLKDRKDLIHPEYDVRKLHGIAHQTIVSRRRTEKKAKVEKMRTRISEMKNAYAGMKNSTRLEGIDRNHKKLEINGLEKKLKTFEEKKEDFLTEYLLDAIPRMNYIHMMTSRLATCTKPEKRLRIAFARGTAIDEYVEKYFPNLRKRSNELRTEQCRTNVSTSPCCVAPLVQAPDSSIVCTKCGVLVKYNAINISNPMRKAAQVQFLRALPWQHLPWPWQPCRTS